MLNIQLARKYARAMFELAQEEDKLVEYGKELAEVREVIDSIPAAGAFLLNPQVDNQAKKDLLKKAFEKNVSTEVYHFLLLLVDKRRIGLIGTIEDLYRGFSYDARGIVIADVTTAKPASEKQQKKITEKLEQVTGKSIKLRLHVDDRLIGGVVVQIGDKRIDGSVTGRLMKLRKELLANK